MVACSDARARALLASLPPRPAWERGTPWEAFHPKLSAWQETVEAAGGQSCADASLAPLRVDVNDTAGVCVGYADGTGGTYWRCSEAEQPYYGWEGPL